MSDPATAPTQDVQPPLPRDSASQAYVAGMIVVGLVVVALGSLVTAYVIPGEKSAALGIASVVCGGLINALNAPTGIANVLASMVHKTPPANG